jgi:N,N'-diacetyllegionaminate synthase
MHLNNISKNQTLVIAEVGVNHNGKIRLAKELIKKAKKCRADYVKFQMYIPDELSTKIIKKAKYQRFTTNKNETQHEMLEKYYLDFKKIKILFNYCKKLKIKFLASVFDLKSLNLYKKLKPDFIKLPSGEITNYFLLEALSKTKIPILFSTGMSNFKEVKHAFKILTSRGNQAIPMYCISSYPAKLEEINFIEMSKLCKLNKFFGFSDHTPDIDASLFAVIRGARIIEKHFTLNNKLYGPDHSSSLEPYELTNLINRIKNYYYLKKILHKKKINLQCQNINYVRKSLVAKTFIKQGDIFSVDNISAKRSFKGVTPMKAKSFLGKSAKKDYNIDDII